MDGTLYFSSKADNYLLIAQELEQAGFKEAATYLRQKAESFKEVRAVKEEAEWFQKRDAWNSYLEQLRHFVPMASPPIITPDIRSDQITS